MARTREAYKINFKEFKRLFVFSRNRKCTNKLFDLITDLEKKNTKNCVVVLFFYCRNDQCQTTVKVDAHHVMQINENKPVNISFDSNAYVRRRIYRTQTFGRSNLFKRYFVNVKRSRKNRTNRYYFCYYYRQKNGRASTVTGLECIFRGVRSHWFDPIDGQRDFSQNFSR